MAWDTSALDGGTSVALSALIPFEFEPDARMLAKKKSFFGSRGWMGKGTNSPIIICDNFENGRKPGKTVKIEFYKDLNSAPKSGDTSTVGADEQMVNAATSCTIHQFRHKTKNKGRFDEQQKIHKSRSVFVPALGKYFGHLTDLLAIRHCYTGAAAISDEDDAYTEIAAWTSGAYTSQHRVVYGGDATAWGNIDAGDVFNIDTAFRLSAGLRQAGRDPIVIDGREVLGLAILSPGQVFTLKSDPRWSENQKLFPMSKTNPFFTGELFDIDGVAYFADYRNPKALGVFSDVTHGPRSSILYHDMSNASFDKVEAIVLSAQGLAYAPETEMGIDPDEITDAGNQFGLVGRTVQGWQVVSYNDNTIASANTVNVGLTYVATAAPNDLAALGA